MLGTDRETSRKLLANLAVRGWLTRLHRNLYVTVPLHAAVPSDWREDPWVVAVTAFDPCYIGGWSAAEHWDLTDQIFREVVVVTARRVRSRHPSIQDTTFRLKVVPEHLLFGTNTVWHHQMRIQLSDPSRTVADVLDDPRLGGGIRHVSEILSHYFASDLRADDLLIDYVRRINNRSAFKRLGYLLQALGIDAPRMVATCLAEKSAGFTSLDPTMPRRGPLLRRWNLQVNSHVADPDA